MRRVCAMCNAECSSMPAEAHAAHIVTHSLCDTCSGMFTKNATPPVQEFLDRFHTPILIVDGDFVALTANLRATEFLGRTLTEIRGLRGGELIECVHSYEPGGCGRTINCVRCPIRGTVTFTFETGRSHLREPASASILVANVPISVEGRISTQKVKDVVLLRIDSMLEV